MRIYMNVCQTVLLNWTHFCKDTVRNINEICFCFELEKLLLGRHVVLFYISMKIISDIVNPYF